MLSCEGDPNVLTPNIDNLAEYGVRFSQARSNFPLCCPIRGTMLTGRHAHDCIPGHDYRLPEGEETLAHVFQRHGYRTAWFGKWHVNGPRVRQPDGTVDWVPRPVHPSCPHGQENRNTCSLVPREVRGGFESWLGYENNNSPHNTWVHGHDECGQEIDLYRLPKFETDALTDCLIDYLQKRSPAGGGDGQPFFASLSVQPPHDPYGAPEEFMRHYQPAKMQMRENVPPVDWIEEEARRSYAGACALVENIDWNLGRIRAALREARLDTNTYIIFFSDHGDMHGSHGLFHKTNPYEESVGVPFIIGGGLDVQNGAIRRVDDRPITLLDLPPTTLGLCGITPPETMAGHDYSSVKSWKWGDPEPAAGPDSAYLQLVIPTGHGDSTDRSWRGVVTRDGWKYVCLEGQDWLMFDLKTDPYELANLAHNSKFREKRAELRARLRQWIAESGDRFPVPENPA